ncbi:hypothetical protein BDW42DRAFT_177759 [Aspergillus taichungensis]|uniref:Uncharacterized protein n=1 Tax=Aspergillus taichungensis TaxID=482145 RepID=A0A2J5HIS8_9EURO|nr:hypothetical protein BDW42DRAFT_177759 [Aspergillus taichungensis]
MEIVAVMHSIPECRSSTVLIVPSLLILSISIVAPVGGVDGGCHLKIRSRLSSRIVDPNRHGLLQTISSVPTGYSYRVNNTLDQELRPVSPSAAFPFNP